MSYSTITLTTNTHFSWSYPYVNGAVVISDINDLTVNTPNLIASMPYGGNVEIGTSVIFNNLGPNSVNLMDFWGAQAIVTIPKQTVVTVYLIGSSETSDTWRAISNVGGGIGVTGVSLIASDNTLNISGGTTTAGNAANMTIGTNTVLQSFAALNSKGIVVSKTATGDDISTVTMIANNNISITNPDGSGGNIIIGLTPTVQNLGGLNIANSNITDGNNNSINFVASSNTDSVVTLSNINLNGVVVDTSSDVTGINNLQANNLNVGGLNVAGSNITDVNNNFINFVPSVTNNSVVTPSGINLNGVIINTSSNVTGINNLDISGNFTSIGDLNVATITAGSIALTTPYIAPSSVSSQCFFSDANTLTTTPAGNIITLQSSINISSVTGANGQYTINFTQPYIDGTYIVQLTLCNSVSSITPFAAFYTDRTTENFHIYTLDTRGNIIPVTAGISVCVWGELAS